MYVVKICLKVYHMYYIINNVNNTNYKVYNLTLPLE